jgi:DNA-binding response OmpR family regulator
MEKILFLDDSPSLLQLYAEEFTEDGFEVILAENGKEAFMKLEKESPQLVVMDVHIPIIDGCEMLTALLSKDPYVPVIVNTATPMYGEKSMPLGIEAYVVKSSDLTELKQKIREVFENRRNPRR